MNAEKLAELVAKVEMRRAIIKADPFPAIRQLLSQIAELRKAVDDIDNVLSGEIYWADDLPARPRSIQDDALGRIAEARAIIEKLRN